MQIEPGTKIWLEFGGTRVLLPVNPSEIEDNTSVPQDTFKILESGQVGIPQFPDLKIFKFKSFFPGDAEPFVSSEALDPVAYCNLLTEAMNEAEVGRLIINRDNGWNTNIRCVIRNFKLTDKGGEPNDIYYQIELVEYRDYQPEKIVVNVTKRTYTTKSARPVKKVMRVGATVIANGTYCYDSYGSKPHGTAKNLKIKVKRIVPGRPYPILIGSYGWIKESNLQIKG